METQNQTPSADDQSILTRVREIMTEGKENITGEVDASLTKFRAEILTALNQVSSGQKAPVATPAPAATPGLPSFTPSKLTVALGLSKPWEPVIVPFTRDQALASLATKEGPNNTVNEIAQRGLQAIGIEAAFRSGLIQAPRKGLTPWQAAGIGIATTAVAAGAVIGTMYVTEVGPFARTE